MCYIKTFPTYIHNKTSITMPGHIKLSDDVELIVFKQYIKVVRYKTLGRRSVNVPRKVVAFSVEQKDQIKGALVTDETGVEFHTPINNWRVCKSFFLENATVYIGYAKYKGDDRVG